jgi:CubicO group peptidase (beta-lactamase class C family)
MKSSRSFTTEVLKSTLFVFLSLGVAGACPGQTKSAQVDKLIRALAQRGQFSGSVLVAEDGRIIYQRGFGQADSKRGIVFSPQTPTYLASLTKQFTAMGIMMLAEQHKLSYNDPLSKYFPEFPSYAQKITIRHLLNHTAGIADYVGLGLERPGLTNKDVFDVLMRQDSPRFAPGEKWEYSNSGYILLGLIVEKVSGQPYRLFLKRHIFAPLGMNHTFVYDKSTPDVTARARGYNRFGDDSDYDLLTYGEGGIYSTVTDMFKWDQALQTEKLVKRSTLDEAFTCGKLNDGSLTNYGFGWAISEVNGEPIQSHGGRYGGFNTYIKRFPNERATIIFLTNRDFKNMSAIGNALISVLHDQPYNLPKLSIAELLYRVYRTNGISAAVKEYRRVKAASDPAYDFSESELNELGYELLAKNEVTGSIEILKLNAAAFPSSWNVYDSLGDAYAKNGDKQLAIENYQKSLELNPGDSNAATMLKKLRG